MELIYTSQGEAEDVLLRHRYLYYVMGQPCIADEDYDTLERAIREQWPIGVVQDVGSSNPFDYPEWVRAGRKPLMFEAHSRDKAVVDRWMREI